MTDPTDPPRHVYPDDWADWTADDHMAYAMEIAASSADQTTALTHAVLALTKTVAASTGLVITSVIG